MTHVEVLRELVLPRLMYEELEAMEAAIAALEAVNVMREAHDFWAHYSCISQSNQDDYAKEKDAMLEKMLSCIPADAVKEHTNDN